MSNRYCITFNIMDTNEKIKIDYGCVQVEEQCLKVNMNMFTFKSSISNEIFTLKKKQFGYVNFIKKEKQIVFQCVFKSFSDDLCLFEAEYIPFCVKYICRKIPFRFSYKKALKERAKKILG